MIYFKIRYFIVIFLLNKLLLFHFKDNIKYSNNSI